MPLRRKVGPVASEIDSVRLAPSFNKYLLQLGIAIPWRENPQASPLIKIDCPLFLMHVIHTCLKQWNKRKLSNGLFLIGTYQKRLHYPKACNLIEKFTDLRGRLWVNYRLISFCSIFAGYDVLILKSRRFRGWLRNFEPNGFHDRRWFKLMRYLRPQCAGTT